MVHSVELLFDCDTESAVRGIWDDLMALGVRSQAAHTSPSNRPHVTLTVADRMDDAVTAALSPALAQLPLPCRIGAPMLFGGRSITLVRLVVPSAGLLALQADVHRICLPHMPNGPLANAEPGQWTPHVTLARRMAAGVAGLALAAFGIVPVAAAHTVGEPGDPTMLVHINDSAAGGSYHQEFERAYAGTTPDGTPVYIYVPEGGIGGADGVDSLDPSFDHNPADDFTPCADNTDAEFLITQAQIDQLGAELSNHIVAVDEAHFGDIGTAVGEDGTSSDALVMLVYNVQDESYYDCSVTSYTAATSRPSTSTRRG